MQEVRRCPGKARKIRRGEQRGSEAEARAVGGVGGEVRILLKILNAMAQRTREDYVMTLPADRNMSARSRR